MPYCETYRNKCYSIYPLVGTEEVIMTTLINSRSKLSLSFLR